MYLIISHLSSTDCTIPQYWVPATALIHSLINLYGICLWSVNKSTWNIHLINYSSFAGYISCMDTYTIYLSIYGQSHLLKCEVIPSYLPNIFCKLVLLCRGFPSNSSLWFLTPQLHCSILVWHPNPSKKMSIFPAGWQQLFSFVRSLSHGNSQGPFP